MVMESRGIMVLFMCLVSTVCCYSCSSEGAEPPHGGGPELEIELTDPYWQQLFPEHWPGQRIAYATAYDTARRRLVLYGGWRGQYPNIIYLNDTWEFDGTDWTEIQTANRPEKGRSGTAMCYVKPWKKTILFGGAGGDAGTGATDETWSYDGIDWTILGPATIPPTRVGAAMAFDENLGKVLLAGGVTVDGIHDRDCWLFDGQDWELLAGCSGGTSQPLGRMMPGMVWNPVSRRIVLFGGEYPFNNYWNDTWEFYELRFHKVTTATSAPFRHMPAMTFHALSGKCLFFGGAYRPVGGSYTKCNDLWEYDGIDWREIPVRNPPAPRDYVTIEYCPLSQSVYLYGGHGDDDENYFAEDTWKYSTVVSTATSTPTLGLPGTLVLASLFTIIIVPLTSRLISRRRRSRSGPENSRRSFTDVINGPGVLSREGPNS